MKSNSCNESKTCLKRPLKDIQNKGRKDKWTLNEGRNIAFCNTLDLQYAINALETHFYILFE